MAAAKQIELSDFIKSIHKELREEAKILGIEEAWQNHCNDEEKLGQYAKAMQELAVNHWDNNLSKDTKVISRVFWVYEACREYFQYIDKYRDKEEIIVRNTLCLKEKCNLKKRLESCTNQKYELLDVGSCYNPFKQFELFNVCPIDIAPAIGEVYKCDFLNVKLAHSVLFEDRVVKELPKDSFDVIVFSLLLEYLPSPNHRLKCCLTAYNLLKPEGVLIIITPDSNHVGSNAKIIKSWRYVLAKHGFARIKYEKLPHLHCMVFRKSLFKETAQRWARIYEGKDFFDNIYIPQDFQSEKNKVVQLEKLEKSSKWTHETFLNSLCLDTLDEEEKIADYS